MAAQNISQQWAVVPPARHSEDTSAVEMSGLVASAQTASATGVLRLMEGCECLSKAPAAFCTVSRALQRPRAVCDVTGPRASEGVLTVPA